MTGGKSLLSIRLQYDDYTPDYCSEACVRDAFTTSPEPASDTVEFGMRRSSYGQMYFSSVQVATVDMGQPVSAIAGFGTLPARLKDQLQARCVCRLLASAKYGDTPERGKR